MLFLCVLDVLGVYCGVFGWFVGVFLVFFDDNVTVFIFVCLYTSLLVL